TSPAPIAGRLRHALGSLLRRVAQHMVDKEFRRRRNKAGRRSVCPVAGPPTGASAGGNAAGLARCAAAAQQAARSRSASAGAAGRTGSAETGTTRRAGLQGLGRQQAFALHLLANQLAGAANGFRLLTRLLLGGLLVM